MKLTSIDIENMKGQTTEQSLTGMDIFTGHNGAGKTTRLQAIAYGMLGYVPGGKKTPAETFKMATGDRMRVGITTDTFAFARTLTKSSRRNSKTGETTVSIKESLSLSPGAGERTDTEKDMRIKEEMGDFPVMLDFGEFLAMSDAKRRDFIYGLSTIDSSAWDRDRVHKYLIDELLTNDLQNNNQIQYDAISEQIAKVIAQYPKGYAVSDGLQSMLDWAESERRYWTSKQKDAQGAVRQISEQKNEIEETERGIKEQKESLSALEEALISFEKQSSSAGEKLKVIDTRCKRSLRVLQEIEQMKAAPKVDTATLDANLAALRAGIKLVPDIGKELQVLFEQAKTARAETSKLQLEKSNIDGMISMIRSTIQSLDDALSQIGKLKGRCVASAAIACPKDFTDPKLTAGIEKNKAAAAAKIGELNAQAAAIVLRMKDFEKQEESLANQRAQLEKSVRDANETNSRINTDIAKIAAEKEQYTKAEATRENTIKMYQAELQRLTEENNQNDESPQSIREAQEKATQAATETREKVTEIKATIEQKEKARQALILVQQSMVENMQADYNATAMKLIYEKLGPKGAQGEIVKEIIEPIRADIAANLHLMGFSEKPFFDTESDTGKEIFQFGWRNERGHKVNFDALSAGQQTVFLAAILVTIIDRKNPKTRLLVMDNLNHLDAHNFQLIVYGLSKLKDKLDNIILAGAIEFEFEADGWKIWNLVHLA